MFRTCKFKSVSSNVTPIDSKMFLLILVLIIKHIFFAEIETKVATFAGLTEILNHLVFFQFSL